jgi:hypothetical protein
LISRVSVRGFRGRRARRGSSRADAVLVEITDLLALLAGYPAGMRIIVRRERRCDRLVHGLGEAGFVSGQVIYVAVARRCDGVVITRSRV